MPVLISFKVYAPHHPDQMTVKGMEAGAWVDERGPEVVRAEACEIFLRGDGRFFF
jgi:hypothetical protein